MAVTAGVNELLLQDIYMVYENAEQVMLSKIANRVKRGVTTAGWNERKLNEVQALRREIEMELAKVHAKVIPSTANTIISGYLRGINGVNGDLKLPKTSLDKIEIPYHIQRLVMDANEIVKGASFRILRESMDAYRAVIADSNAMLMTGTETRLAASQRALNNFAAAGITGFVDKAGRKWEMASYAEMAIRTGASKAALQGHIDRSQDFGHDLMIVSHFGKTCPICAPWEGVPISISGKDPNYSSLATAKAAGLFHPNCKHTLLAYFPGITDVPNMPSNDDQAYDNMQKQRANERQIRKWKRVSSVALTPQAKVIAEAKVRAWQDVQRKHVEVSGLTRRYAREGIRSRTGIAANAKIGPQQLKMDDDAWKERQRKALAQAGAGPVPIVPPVKPAVPPLPRPQPPAVKKKYVPFVPPGAPPPKPVVKAAPKEKKITFNSKVTTLRANMNAIDPGLIGRVIADIEARMAPNAKKILAKNQNKFNFQSFSDEDKGFYQRGSKLVRVDKILDDEKKNSRGKFATLYHEIGHAMDAEMGKPSHNNATYMKALKADWKALEGPDGLMMGLRRKMDGIMYDDVSNGVQDIVGGLSGGKVKGRWGHSMEYWNRSDVYKEATSELFAHMFQATTDPKAAGYIKDWFPTSWKWFNDWLDSK